MSATHPRLALLAAVATIAAAGCGSTTTVGDRHTFSVALSEYRVTPQDVHATAGETAIYVHNYGRLTHDLVLTFEGQMWATTKPIAPGEGTELTTALIPGRYEMASSLLSDQALGAYGTLDVSR
ncbi:MAG: cupredoxin domain-containing protein [Solirubrobacteraceae bacterium]